MQNNFFFFTMQYNDSMTLIGRYWIVPTKYTHRCHIIGLGYDIRIISHDTELHTRDPMAPSYTQPGKGCHPGSGCSGRARCRLGCLSSEQTLAKACAADGAGAGEFTASRGKSHRVTEQVGARVVLFDSCTLFQSIVRRSIRITPM